MRSEGVSDLSYCLRRVEVPDLTITFAKPNPNAFYLVPNPSLFNCDLPFVSFPCVVSTSP